MSSQASSVSFATAQQRSLSTFEHDLIAGLSKTPRSVSPKYFYDAAGSALFDRICTLPEYYPTRTELRILSENQAEIAHAIGPNADLIEFGAGSLTKVRLLIDAFEADAAPRRYLPIDISGEHLEGAAESLRASYPRLTVQPIVADYTLPLALPRDAAGPGRRAGFFPGSTLGNFTPDEALSFLRTAANLLRGGGMLIGVDLVKDPAVLHDAYNDAQGVTAAFNLNLLQRANTELGADFNIDGFSHYAMYNPVVRRIEMHLVCLRGQTVTVADRQFVFREGDTIHTESSHKFTLAGFRKLAVDAGFLPGAVWTDKDKLFSVHWLNAPA